MNNGGAEAAVAPVGGPQPLEWKFSQVFGERTAGEEIHDELEITLLPEIEEVGWFCLKGQTLKMYVADCFLLFFYISEAVLFVSLTVLLQCSDDPSPSSSIYAIPIHMALKNTVSMLWISLMSLF
ncbi:hypothetical protein ERO13_D01G081751v2 [Gossypium hirsutum]|nr:hypothetical protein ERO13_D01G081751v2 [Gossypium hirsutum]